MEGEENLELYALNINFDSNVTSLLEAEAPVLIASLPTKTASNFRYSSGVLVFTDLVYADGNLSSTKEQDEAWESRGTSALVFDEANVRFWDTWFVAHRLDNISSERNSGRAPKPHPCSVSSSNAARIRRGKWVTHSITSSRERAMSGTWFYCRYFRDAFTDSRRILSC